MNKFFGMLSLLFVTPLLFAASQKLNLNSAEGATRFLAIGKPSSLRISGNGSGPTGQLSLDGNQISGALEVNLQSLETGISMRDRHMKEKYLETEKYPKATLVLGPLTLPKELLVKGKTETTGLAFEGELQLHNGKQNVSGTVDVRRNDDTVQVIAKFKTKISDFGISIPSYAGITVADEVQVEVETKLKTLN